MTTEDHSLGPEVRAALSRWSAVEVADGFADRVMARVAAEQSRPRPDEAPRQSSARARGIVVALVAGGFAMAAALLLWVWTPPSSVSATHRAGIADAEQVREVLRLQCLPCHEGTNAAAQPGALAVFDLSQATWFERMSDDQLRALPDRLVGQGATQVRSFVDAELGERAGRG